MSEPEDSVESRLAELGAATEPIRARAGFADRVLQAVQVEAVGWPVELLRSARRLAPLGAVMAAVALVWALASSSAADEALAVADQTVELEW